MNGGNDDQVVLLGNFFDERDDLERCGGVETGRRLVKEEELWARDQLRGDTDTALLTARDALSDRCADEVVGLIS